MSKFKDFLEKRFPNAYKYLYDPSEIPCTEFDSNHANIHYEDAGRTFPGRVIYGYIPAPWYGPFLKTRVLKYKRYDEEVSPGVYEAVQYTMYYPETLFTKVKKYEVTTYYTFGNRIPHWTRIYRRNGNLALKIDWDANGTGVALWYSLHRILRKSQMLFNKLHGFTQHYKFNGDVRETRFYIDGADCTDDIEKELGYWSNTFTDADLAFIKLKYLD